MSTVTVTKHAIDRASQRLLRQWAIECPKLEPGLATWLQAIADKTWQLHRTPGRYLVGKVKLVYRLDERGRPMLVTVALVQNRKLKRQHGADWVRQERRKQAEADAVGEHEEDLR